jgi:hypothetical protein
VAENKDQTTLSSMDANMDRLARAAKELKDHPGLGGITGKTGAFPDIPGSKAANARAKLNTLKSQVAFSVLQDMRANSKTGGALGAVSDKEGQLLENNLGALDTAQSVEEYQKALQDIIDYTDGAKARAREAFTRSHGQQQKSGTDLKPSLSPGTVVMRAPDGTERPVPADQVEHYKKLGATVVQK